MPDFNSKKKPVGESIRDLINPALEDDRKPKIQLDILDKIFENTAGDMSEILANNLSRLFNRLSGTQSEDKNPQIITLLTMVDSQGNPLYSPILRLRIPVCVDFAEFTPAALCELPGYIKLHMAARDEDVAVSVTGLTTDDVRKGGPVFLTLDCSKTYEQGAVENPHLYPQLPEPLPPPPLKTPKDFRLD